MSSISSILRTNGAKAGGIIIYNAAKISAQALNLTKDKLRIYSDTKSRLRVFFPFLDLSNLRIVKNAILPANWFESPNQTEGMTFGSKIYSSKSDLQYDYDGILLLIHEL